MVYASAVKVLFPRTQTIKMTTQTQGHMASLHIFLCWG